jgi:hypothetical protein
MPSLYTEIRCPFCFQVLQLGALPIVATSRSIIGSAAAQGGDGALFDGLSDGSTKASATDGRRRPASGQEVLGWIGQWPVIAKAPLATVPKATGIRRLVAKTPTLQPLDEAGPREDRPARICTHCKYPLPRTLDTRDWFTIAVVGVNFASKTHFIATALQSAYYDQALQGLGCVEFEPEGPSGEVFHNKYYVPVFEDKKALGRTMQDREGRRRFEPLVFKTEFESSSRPSLLLFHDVSGEDLQDFDTRPQVAPFVANADAIIFIVDPRWLPRLRKPLFDGTPSPGVEQMHMFSSVLDDVADSNVPTVITLSKSDLLRPLIGKDFRMFRPPPSGRERWLADLAEIDVEVRSLLHEFGASALLAKAARMEQVTFCAISPLGSDPGDKKEIPSLAPFRVLDPIAAALTRIPGLGA